MVNTQPFPSRAAAATVLRRLLRKYPTKAALTIVERGGKFYLVQK